MSNERGQELNEHHNDGQEDASEGKYEPPHSITPLDAIIQSDHTFDRMVEDNEAYDEGYHEGRSHK